ncbi:MAG: hypothetical protein PHS14_19510 [Elusimicrobia bacterium]|nr:hypothetical protein [Elusimicrobiota bacterium]
MALKTGGTPANSSLNCIQWFSAMNKQDLAAFNALITYAAVDAESAVTTKPIPTVSQGILYLSGRGQIKLTEGDWLYVDPATGWPFVVPNVAVGAIASGKNFEHSA